MHFGTENPKVPARTDGKPARAVPAVVERRGILYIELPRDHPRLVQAPASVFRAYRANVDMQPILCIRNDVRGELPQGLTIIEYIGILEAILEEQEARNPELKNAMKELWAEKLVLDSDEYCERVIDYVVSYACKGEVSSTEAVEMFRQITENSLDGSTPTATLAQKLNMRLIKSKEVPKPEAVFELQRLALYSSSRNVVTISLRVGDREVQVQQADHDDDEGQDGARGGPRAGEDDAPPGALKPNQFDKYCKGRDDGSVPAQVSFDAFNRQNGAIPNYLHGRMRATWPLTEEYCSTMLLLHKPVSAFAELKGHIIRFSTPCASSVITCRFCLPLLQGILPRTSTHS